ncbi:MAG TPA: hypothetical protein DCQ06_13090 [Myxococcales bacterium]|nr:hypothetical protein [Myxococcales bacterium]HAN32524.1 hypothetical protein [Myxococcales bacterium]
MQRRILLVCPYFTPSRAIGARRVEKLAVALDKRGWQVTVLTLQGHLTGAADAEVSVPERIEIIRTWAPLPRAIAAKLLPKPSTSPVPSAPVSAPAMATRTGSFRTWIRRLLEGYDRYDRWALTATSAVRGRKFDVILASIPPRVAAHIASKIARRSSARLVLDYRDPWIMTGRWRGLPSAPAPIDGDGSVPLAKFRQQERAILAQAALVISTTPTITNMIQGRCSTPVITIPTGFAGQVYNEPGAQTSPHLIAYTGSLAYGRSLLPLFEAFASLRQRLPPTDLRLVYCGPSSATARAEAERAGVSDYLDDKGSVAPAQARLYNERASAVVVVVSELYDYAYPGKMFEIMQSGRPMLSLSKRASDASELVTRYKLGWSCRQDDIVSIADAIVAACQGDAPHPIDLDELQTDILMDRAVDAIEACDN